MRSCSYFRWAGSTPGYAIDRAHYRELYQKLGAAAKQKDWQAARDTLTEIGRELPAPTPRYFLTVASIEAQLGHKEEALRWLAKFAATGLNFDLAQDEELKGLLADPAGQKIAAQMKQRSLPKTGTELVCSLPQTDTMPEDITYLKSTQSEIRRQFLRFQHSAPHALSVVAAQGWEQGMHYAGTTPGGRS